ncbi:hypothetical protein HK097_003650 [Rhizophlyctis rosea]|uniref:Uncharacterized protein n=1 Tax=Rhizophlyctis rosea TaxID=64517 RepID=A0AAD5SFV7_9FUNG|nr:hypothetical protein HK097_003650 [Rhizophlyctis rosea]
MLQHSKQNRTTFDRIASDMGAILFPWSLSTRNKRDTAKITYRMLEVFLFELDKLLEGYEFRDVKDYSAFRPYGTPLPGPRTYGRRSMIPKPPTAVKSLHAPNADSAVEIAKTTVQNELMAERRGAEWEEWVREEVERRREDALWRQCVG